MEKEEEEEEAAAPAAAPPPVAGMLLWAFFFRPARTTADRVDEEEAGVEEEDAVAARPLVPVFLIPRNVAAHSGMSRGTCDDMNKCDCEYRSSRSKHIERKQKIRGFYLSVRHPTLRLLSGFSLPSGGRKLRIGSSCTPTEILLLPLPWRSLR